MSNKQNTLVTIVGSTASGKTDVAIKVADYFKTDIISADSRQFYKEIPIGTAAPEKSQLDIVNHHFVGHLSIHDNYNVSQFEQDVLNLLKQKFSAHNCIVMAGGSGLYVDAVCNGIDDLPNPDEKLRNELNNRLKEQGIESLQKQLKLLDPVYFAQVDLQNPKRLIRAIEVCLQTGKRYSDLRLKRTATRDFNILKIGLNLPRPELFERINQRTEKMIKNGWLKEAESMFNFRDVNALNTVGYKELFNYISGEWTLEKAIERIKTNTRRYAKRQLTWFKRDDEIHWFHPDDTDNIIKLIREVVSG